MVFASCSTWATTGSVYRSPCSHWGVRPTEDLGVTVQWSRDWGPCAPSDGGRP